MPDRPSVDAVLRTVRPLEGGLYVWMLLLQPCRTCRGGGTKGASDL